MNAPTPTRNLAGAIFRNCEMTDPVFIARNPGVSLIGPDDGSAIPGPGVGLRRVRYRPCPKGF